MFTSSYDYVAKSFVLTVVRMKWMQGPVFNFIVTWNNVKGKSGTFAALWALQIRENGSNQLAIRSFFKHDHTMSIWDPLPD